MYWNIGKLLSESQKQIGWGNNALECATGRCVFAITRKRACDVGGLLYKTHFFGSKDIRNKTNVNQLCSCQKGAFSYDQALYRHEEGLYCSDPELCCLEVGLHIVRSQPSER